MQLTTEFYKTLRMIFGSRDEDQRCLEINLRGQAANDLIRERLLKNRPCMISRFGSNELDATIRAHELSSARSYLGRLLRYVRGKGAKFWWDRSIRRRMSNVAGFFPATNQALAQFGCRMLEDAQEIDILGSWRNEEWRIREFFPEAKTIDLIDLEPFRHRQPWSMALCDKKVLVVHPFVESIERQYARRERLFNDPNVLPRFELQTLRAIQSHGQGAVPFASWFEALDSMCDEIAQRDFDVAIIGAGAYGLPLAAFVKRLGKSAVHLGGATQLMFGIKGRRWEDGGYDYVINQHWCRPLESEKPPRTDLIEQHAYW